jgi:hypothetical protein
VFTCLYHDLRCNDANWKRIRHIEAELQQRTSTLKDDIRMYKAWRFGLRTVQYNNDEIVRGVINIHSYVLQSMKFEGYDK